MRNPNRFDMTDSEALLVGVDFSPQMAGSDTIGASNSNGTTQVVVFDSAGTDQSGTMIEAGSLNIDGQVLMARIENAIAGERYSMNFMAASSNGDYLETKIVVRAED